MWEPCEALVHSQLSGAPTADIQNWTLRGTGQESTFDKHLKTKFWGDSSFPSYWGPSAHDLPRYETKALFFFITHWLEEIDSQF